MRVQRGSCASSFLFRGSLKQKMQSKVDQEVVICVFFVIICGYVGIFFVIEWIPDKLQANVISVFWHFFLLALHMLIAFQSFTLICLLSIKLQSKKPLAWSINKKPQLKFSLQCCRNFHCTMFEKPMRITHRNGRLKITDYAERRREECQQQNGQVGKDVLNVWKKVDRKYK